MSAPDSVHPSALRPVPSVLALVPRPASSLVRVREALEQLPPAALAAAGLVAILTVSFFSGRVLAVNLTYHFFTDSTGTARILGAVSFLSIVAIAAAMALGHRGLRALTDERRLARHVTTIVLGVAYLHLVMWATRAIAASVAAASSGSSALFLPNVFWWG